MFFNSVWGEFYFQFDLRGFILIQFGENLCRIEINLKNGIQLN